LTDGNIDKILGAYQARHDEPYFAALISNDDLAVNGYNLSVSSYVEAKDTKEAVDIKALNTEIAQIVARQAQLRQAIDAIVADLEAAS